ncbi:MAG: DUF4928 family protein [Phaeodactylibacter sp.]|nr:DUF4928 family protein [Phaeodactylibacter sp.]MCB9304284.1 DUF4928 family protein [Lewinellaceae bacterium]
MSEGLNHLLSEFYIENTFNTKGKLSVALIMTRKAKEEGLPLNPESLLTDKGGQVKGLGGGAVQKILDEYEIHRVLAREGGRTSRGSIANMEIYVAFLNSIYFKGFHDLDYVEKFWIEKVRDFFASQPLNINLDQAISIRATIQHLLDQAKERQQENPFSQYQGTVIQHLVGAKLEHLNGEGAIIHHSSSTSDSQRGRPGDFEVGDAVLHITTAPGEALIKKCEENLRKGVKPIIVTLENKVSVAQGLAENNRLADRIDVFEIGQFLATNIYEIGKFEFKGQKDAVEKLIIIYNEIIDKVETDPSLKIKFYG